MSIEEVRKLLIRQKAVDSVGHVQNASRRHVIATLAHRQHRAELGALLARLQPREIATLLAKLTVDEARSVWPAVSVTCVNEVLWELPGGLCHALTGIDEPDFLRGEINAYHRVGDRLLHVAITRRADLEKLQLVWLDLLGATAAERACIGRHCGLVLPPPEEAADLEVSSRFRIEEGAEVHLHSNFLLERAGAARSVPVAIVIRSGIIFSVRSEDLPVFRLQRRRVLSRSDQFGNCFDILLGLYGADVEYSADSLQDVYATLNRVGRQVLSEDLPDDRAAAVLAEAAAEEDRNGRIRGNVMDTQRALTFLVQSKLLSAEQTADAREALRNIESLNGHSAFLFDKINFLMDVTIGFINVNQNRRVSRLTVFSVVFMPINILAGIGGMSEFSMMTQGVPWPVAYGLFAGAMVLIGWATYFLVSRLEGRRQRRKRSGGGDPAV